MKPRDRVLAAGHGERVDRTPVTPYMGNYGAAVAGVPIDEYCRDSDTMAGAQLTAQERIGHDMLVAQSDGYYMAEALGMETVRRPNTTPAPAKWPIEDLAGVDVLTVPDPQDGGRMPVYLGAIRKLVEASEGRLAVRGCGTGALSLAGHMMGPDNFVMALALLDVEPDPVAESRLRRLMEIATETTTRFAIAALEAGADVVMNGDSLASLDMISPAIYEKWAWPYERQFFDAVRPEADARGALTILHICGNTTPILDLMTRTGAHVLEVDWKVSLTEARRVAGAATAGRVGAPATIDAPPPKSSGARPGAPPFIALMGNLDPSAVLLQGSPAEVGAAAARAIEEAATGATATGATAGRTGFLLGSGCEVAPLTPIENMRALVRAAERIGGTQ